MLELSVIGLMTAFAAGVISFVSPCVLPLVPGYVSYVAGATVAQTERAHHPAAKVPAVALSFLFVLGFSTIFVILGASATALGQLLLSYRYETNIVGGVIIIAFGLFMMDFLRLPWLQRELRFNGQMPGGRPVGAYVLGLAFAFGWTPCIGPVLGAILTVGAVSATILDGVVLLSFYSLGLGLPFMLAAVFTGGFLARMPVLRRLGRPLKLVAGGVMVLMGIGMITGYMSTFAYWMLMAFPVFGSIG